MFRFKVMPEGKDAFEITATTRDISKWEKTNKGASFAGLQQNMHMTDLYKIAFNAASRRGDFDGSLKDFEETCDLDILDDEEADPTQSAVS